MILAIPVCMEKKMNSIDIEIFEGLGYSWVKNSKKIAEDKRTITFEADIQGGVKYLESYIQNDLGTPKRIIIIPTNIQSE